MMMRPHRWILALGTLLMVGLAPTSARAEHERETGHVPAPAAPSGGQLDNGKTSLTKLLPPITRVFDYSGSIGNRSTMFGDLGGDRTQWYENGFTLDAQLTQVIQGVASGGNASGNGSTRYNGLLEINSTLDTAKLGLWSGGLISATAMTSFGRPIKTEAGNVSPVNMTTLWPIPFDTSTELTEYYLTQALSPRAMLILGRIDATNFLDHNSFANNPESQFLNTSLNNQLLLGEFLSFSTYAALLEVSVSKSVKLALAGWNPDTQPGDYGGVWKNYGVGATAIVDYHAFGGLAGVFNPYLLYSSKNTAAFDNPTFSPVSLGPTTRLSIRDFGPGVSSKDDNWIFHVVGEQYLWMPKGAAVSRAKGGRKEDYFVPTQDFVTNQPGVGLFYRFAYTPEDRNPWNISVSGGLGARGVIPGRPHDRMGIGVYAMLASDDIKADSEILNRVLGDEVGVEAYYNFAITPWLQLSPSVQWVSPGITTNDDSWTFGTRLFTRF